MDEKPIKSVLPSGLTVISMRAGREGIIAGEIRLGIGGAHAAKMNPRWEGLPHFMEHMIFFGASRNYAPDERNRFIRDKLFVFPNAWTDLTQTRHFTQGVDAGGYVFSAQRFWPALETTLDGIFFPRFDASTLERERKRVLEEMSQSLTRARLDNAIRDGRMFGVDWLGLHAIGSREQVESYSREDCFTLHQRAYNLPNTCLVVVGDVIHEQAVERIDNLLRDVPKSRLDLPSLEKGQVQTGEFRGQKDGANEGFLDVYLNFPVVNLANSRVYPTSMALDALSRILDDKVKDKFGIYTFGLRHYAASSTPNISINFETGKKEIASDVLAYILELMEAPETRKLITDMHEDNLGRKVAYSEIAQPTIEWLATKTQHINSIGAPLFSLEDIAIFLTH